MQRLFHGRGDALRALVAEAAERTLPRRVAEPGRYDSLPKLEAALRPLCAQLGRFPHVAEIRDELSASAHRATLRQVGSLRAMAAHMGVPWASPRPTTRAEALAEFRTIVPMPAPDLLGAGGGLPRLTTTRIKAMLGPRGIGMLQKHFPGILALNAALAEEQASGQDNRPQHGLSHAA